MLYEAFHYTKDNALFSYKEAHRKHKLLILNKCLLWLWTDSMNIFNLNSNTFYRDTSLWHFFLPFFFWFQQIFRMQKRKANVVLKFLVNSFQPVPILEFSSILDVWLGSEYE